MLAKCSSGKKGFFLGLVYQPVGMLKILKWMASGLFIDYQFLLSFLPLNSLVQAFVQWNSSVGYFLDAHFQVCQSAVVCSPFSVSWFCYWFPSMLCYSVVVLLKTGEASILSSMLVYVCNSILCGVTGAVLKWLFLLYLLFWGSFAVMEFSCIGCSLSFFPWFSSPVNSYLYMGCSTPSTLINTILAYKKNTIYHAIMSLSLLIRGH